MNYEQAREHIQTGDLVAIRKAHGILPTLTQVFTHSPYTHTGVAIWIEGGLWIAEINSGKNHLASLSQFSEYDFDVYECPIEDREAVRKAILSTLRVKITYGIASFIVIGVYNFLKLRQRPSSRKSIVCSQYSNMIYREAGWKSDDDMISPADLVKLLKLKLAVRA